MAGTSASTITISAPTWLRVEHLEDRVTPGTGNFTGPQDNGQFNFAVSIRFNATEADITAIQTAFQNASQILADATDGKHKFGEITLVNNKRAADDAEFWVFPGEGRADATGAEYGVRGLHVNLFM